MKKLLFVFLLLFSGSSFAVSFDCTKFNTGVYKIICESPELSVLDDELSKNYNLLNDYFKKTGEIDEFRIFVKNMLAHRDACTTEDCLIGWYNESLEGYRQINLAVATRILQAEQQLMNGQKSTEATPQPQQIPQLTLDEFFNANPELKNNTEIRLAILKEANSLARQEARSRGSKNSSSDADRAMRENGGEYAKQAVFEVAKDCHREIFKFYDLQDSSCRTLEEWTKRNRP